MLGAHSFCCLQKGTSPAVQGWSTGQSLTSVPQPPHSTLAKKPPCIRHQSRFTARCREPSPPPDLNLQWDHIFLKGSVYSGNHLQAPSTRQAIRSPKTSRNNQGKGWGGRNMWVDCPEELDSVLLIVLSVTFFKYIYIFKTLLKADRSYRPFCSKTWASSKALLLKLGLFTWPAPGTSSVSNFSGLSEVNFHFCKSQAATCFWEVNTPPEKC